jgi:TolA-binding protein
MLDGQSMCNTCKGKNKKVGDCDGCFSVSEFDALQDQREKMQRDVEEKDRRISELISALTQAQSEKSKLQGDMERLQALQKRMLTRELEALDAIDEASTSDDSSTRLAFALDPAFVPSLEQLAYFSGETNQGDFFSHPGGQSARGELLVPKCFLIRRNLTI